MRSSAPEHVHDVLVLGAGFSGIGVGVHLNRLGLEDYVILERGPTVGGTWRDNVYPGCACDVESILYSYSFEPNPEWTRTFAGQAEIQEYLVRTSDKYHVTPHCRFNSTVEYQRWDEERKCWRIKLADGTETAGRVVVSGLGPLSNPVIPKLEGLESFEGPVWHSAQWRHDVDLTGKRVAVIGTGASAIQFVPEVQKSAGHVDLYQRTAPWILPKPDRPVTALEKWIYRNVPYANTLSRFATYAHLESRAVAFVFSPKLLKIMELYARWNLRRLVKDPELRAKLTPTFRLGCKRVLLTNNYYQALTQPNVSVQTEGVARVTPRGIVGKDGVERPADVIIFGTGFAVHEPVKPGQLVGRDGFDFGERNNTVGIEAYKGTTCAGLPNYFFMMGPNTGLGHNSQIYMIESQLEYLDSALKLMRKRGLAAVEPKRDVQDKFNDAIQNRVGPAVWNSGGCNSWYLNKNGKNDVIWPGFTFVFAHMVRKFDLENYVVDTNPNAHKSKKLD